MNSNAHEQAWRGKDYLARLNAGGKVVVCGAGALGSVLVDSLARIGLSKIMVVDFDRVEKANAGTQLYGASDAGSLKVHALRAKVFIATGIEIEAEHKRLDEHNAKRFFRDAKLVVDSFDNSKSRGIVKYECLGKSIPCIHAGLSGDGYAEVVWNENYQVPNDPPPNEDPCDVPLARNLVQLAVAVLCEEILDFLLRTPPRKQGWTITLKDLRIREKN